MLYQRRKILLGAERTIDTGLFLFHQLQNAGVGTVIEPISVSLIAEFNFQVVQSVIKFLERRFTFWAFSIRLCQTKRERPLCVFVKVEHFIFKRLKLLRTKPHSFA